MHVKRFGRNTVAVLALSACAVAGSASVASAKTVKFKVSCVSKIVGAGTTTDKCTSAALGKGTGKSTLIAPNQKSTGKYSKAGKCVSKGTTKVGTDGKQHVKGTITCKGGKGIFKKGAKGKFTAVGGLKNGIVTVDFSGTIKTK